MASDPQQKKVYAWERQWCHWHGANMPTGRARIWVRWACKKYRVPPPVVRALKPGDESSFYEVDRHLVGLLPNHHAVAVALHEAAHAIVWHYRWDISHGPDFMGVFLYLLEIAGIAPRIALRTSAKAMGLRYSHLRGIHPKYIRRRLSG